jgi:hypothetical protein
MIAVGGMSWWVLNRVASPDYEVPPLAPNANYFQMIGRRIAVEVGVLLRGRDLIVVLLAVSFAVPITNRIFRGLSRTRARSS